MTRAPSAVPVPPMSLNSICPRCKNGNPPGSRFCNECGAGLEAAAPVSGDLFELDVGEIDAASAPKSSTQPVLAEAEDAPPSAAAREPRPFSVHFERDGSVSLVVSHADEAASASSSGESMPVQLQHLAPHAKHQSDPTIAPAPPVVARDAAAPPPAREPGMVASAWHEPEPEMPGHLRPPKLPQRAAAWAGAAMVALLACAAGWWGLRPGTAPITATAQSAPRAITADPAWASSYVAASAVLPSVPVPESMPAAGTTSTASVPAPMASTPAALIDSAPTAAGPAAVLALAAATAATADNANTRATTTTPATSSPAVRPAAHSNQARKASHKARAVAAADSPRASARAQKKTAAAATSASRKTRTASAKATAAETRAATAKARRTSAAKLGRPDTVSASSEPASRSKKAKAKKLSQPRSVKPSTPPTPVPSRPA